ncbi:hypothetical protein THAOC_14341, partial [Thalassiosira oceanica]
MCSRSPRLEEPYSSPSNITSSPLRSVDCRIPAACGTRTPVRGREAPRKSSSSEQSEQSERRSETAPSYARKSAGAVDSGRASRPPSEVPRRGGRVVRGAGLGRYRRNRLKSSFLRSSRRALQVAVNRRTTRSPFDPGTVTPRGGKARELQHGTLAARAAPSRRPDSLLAPSPVSLASSPPPPPARGDETPGRGARERPVAPPAPPRPPRGARDGVPPPVSSPPSPAPGTPPAS